MVGTSETPYDLRFRLLGIPVRIHPLFWLVTVMLGWREYELLAVTVWVACVFVSILVHEFGHGLAAKAFDASPSIVLWGLGGLCYSQGDRQSPGQRLAVILCGPGAGFLLLAVVILITSLLTGITPGEQVRVIGALFGVSEMPQELLFKLDAAFKHAAGESRVRCVLVPGADQPAVGPGQPLADVALGRRTGDADPAVAL